MGNEQYVQHDWSPLVWALMLTGMVIAVLAAMTLFLVMASRAGRATGPVLDAVTDPAGNSDGDTAGNKAGDTAPETVAGTGSAAPREPRPEGTAGPAAA